MNMIPLISANAMLKFKWSKTPCIILTHLLVIIRAILLLCHYNNITLKYRDISSVYFVVLFWYWTKLTKACFTHMVYIYKSCFQFQVKSRFAVLSTDNFINVVVLVLFQSYLWLRKTWLLRTKPITPRR